MGSWYVEQLLKNFIAIKSVPTANQNMLFGESYGDLRHDMSDDYYNILSLEKAITRLEDNKQFSELETQILEFVMDGMVLSDIAKKVKLTTITIMKVFSIMCGRIGFSLGDVFTNEGYLEYMIEKHNLTGEQIGRTRELLWRTDEF